jgi:hypothetical protein
MVKAVAAVRAKLVLNTQLLWVQLKLLPLGLVGLEALLVKAVFLAAALAVLVTSSCMSTANAALYARTSWRSITRGIDQVSCGEESHELRNGTGWRDREYH